MPQLKKVVALSCSAKTEQAGAESLSEKFLHTFLEGFSPEQLRIFYPYKMNIAYCKACLECWVKTPGVCSIDDDMAEINEALQEADLIILATPIYFMGFSAKLKTVIERTFSGFNLLTSLDREGQCRHEPRKQKERLALLISTCSYPELNTFDAAKAYFTALCKNCYWENAGEIVIPSSAMGVLPGFYDAKLAAVKDAGTEMAKSNAISAETWKKICADQIDSQKYQETVNHFFSQRMK